MKKGFTLAEILITLAIIGVVAALTIPSVMVNAQKQEFYSKFIKIYSDLSRVQALIINEKGYPSTWSDEDCMSVLDYFQIAQECESATDCLAEKFHLNIANGTQISITNSAGFVSSRMRNEPQRIVRLNNDMVLWAGVYENGRNGDKYSCIISVDTNGKKGPNTVGRDIFSFEYNAFNNKFSGQGRYTSAIGGSDMMTFTRRTYEDLKNHCLSNSQAHAAFWACTELLLSDKAMKY